MTKQELFTYIGGLKGLSFGLNLLDQPTTNPKMSTKLI